jgi:hypothetical protein
MDHCEHSYHYMDQYPYYDYDEPCKTKQEYIVTHDEQVDYVISYEKSLSENHSMPTGYNDPLIHQRILENISRTTHVMTNPVSTLNVHAPCFVVRECKPPVDINPIAEKFVSYVQENVTQMPIDCRLKKEAFDDHVCLACTVTISVAANTNPNGIPIDCRLQKEALPDHSCSRCTTSVNTITDKPEVVMLDKEIPVDKDKVVNEDDGEEYEDENSTVVNNDASSIEVNPPLSTEEIKNESEHAEPENPETDDHGFQDSIYELTRSFDTDLKELQYKCEILRHLINYLKDREVGYQSVITNKPGE